jgi:hypothetical protein
MSERMRSFEEFWPFYLGEHSKIETKRWHTFGSGVAMFAHFVLLPVTRSMWWFLGGFVVGYACAWYSHYCLEKNRPATFKHPYWSFFADIEQFFLMILGWMPGELERIRDRGPTSGYRKAFRIVTQFNVLAYFLAVLALWSMGVFRF